MNISPDISTCPNLISQCSTPKLFWYQTDNAIFIRIVLTDVEKYHLKVERDTFQFRTVLNDVKYFVGIKLCGTVVAEKTSHEKFGREIKVCLIKAHKWTDWPRLQFNKDKNPFIVVDPNHIVKRKSWDDPYARLEERESFEEYKKRMNIVNIPPAASSTSGSDSDDERVIGYD